MASTSPPPPPPPPTESPIRDPHEPEINSTQRNYLEEIVYKRRRIEESQDKSLIHGFQLQQHAAKILESNGLSSLQEAIDEYIQFKKQTSFTVFKSLALHYPNAFSFKLAKLLEVHPSIQTRAETVSLLVHILTEGINNSMSSSIIIELKNPMLHSLKLESEESMLPSLCEAVGLLADRCFQSPLGGWEELLDYVCVECLSGESKLNHMKGLMLLTELPVTVVQNREFWLNEGNFDLVFTHLLNFNFSMDDELKALAYNASISLMIFSKDLQRTQVSDTLLPILLSFIDEQGEEQVLVNSVNRLSDLASVDDGNIFLGKHYEVFWCMIRVAEKEDASKDLRSAAINLIKELDAANANAIETMIENLSSEELKRTLEVSMIMMTYVVEHDLWYEVDNKDCVRAGMTDAFSLGSFLFNCLSLDSDENVFVPMAIEMITMKYASDIDWRLRNAAMFAIGWIANKNFKGKMMIQHYEHLLNLVLKSLDDLNHRVLWATMHTIRLLCEYKEFLMHAQYHKKFLAKLVRVVRCHLCARVQAYAVIAIRCLVTKCGIDKILTITFGEQIVQSLLVLLKHEKQKLQEEAIDTLKSISVLMPEYFRQNHLDTAMEALKVIVSDKNRLPKLFLRAKCLECMVFLVRKVGQDKFEEQEVVQVVESLISLEGKLRSTACLTKCVILKALDQICRCPRVDINKFINKIMPMLLESALPHIDLTVDNPKDDSSEDKHLVETISTRACNTLSYCAIRSSLNFSPHIGLVTQMFIRLLVCPSLEIRKASMLALPKILLSVKVGDKSDGIKRGLAFCIVRSLIIAFNKETDSGLSIILLRLLAECIQSCSPFFTDELIRILAHEINRTLRVFIKVEIEKAQMWSWKGRSESFPIEEAIQDVDHLIATTVNTFKDRFMLYVDDLLSNVVVFLADDTSDRLMAFAISIFNVIMPLFPDKLPPYHERYISTSYHALWNFYPFAQLHATRAIGICAIFGGDQFKSSASLGVSRLYGFMTKPLSISENSDSEDVKTSYDMAVASLGKICEFHRDGIDGPAVIRRWLNLLPLKYDFNEARYAHGLLSKMIQRSDEDLFGKNNENLPKIISVVKEILSTPDRLGTEEAINQMIDFIDQHGGMEGYKS